MVIAIASDVTFYMLIISRCFKIVLDHMSNSHAMNACLQVVKPAAQPKPASTKPPAAAAKPSPTKAPAKQQRASAAPSEGKGSSGAAAVAAVAPAEQDEVSGDEPQEQSSEAQEAEQKVAAEPSAAESGYTEEAEEGDGEARAEGEADESGAHEEHDTVPPKELSAQLSHSMNGPSSFVQDAGADDDVVAAASELPGNEHEAGSGGDVDRQMSAGHEDDVGEHITAHVVKQGDLPLKGEASEAAIEDDVGNNSLELVADEVTA